MADSIKLPKKLKVGTLTYDVKYPYRFLNNIENYAGLHWSTRSDILISKFTEDEIPRSNAKIFETFLHETFHAVDFFYLNSLFEEDEIDKLAKGMLGVLLDNNLDLDANDSIPKKIKVGIYTYVVNYPFTDPDYPEVLYLSDNERCIFYLKGSSSGSVTIPIEITKNCFMYLIFAAIISLYNLNRLYFDTKNSSMDDEAIMNPLLLFSRGVYQVFKDNKIYSLVNSQRSLINA